MFCLRILTTLAVLSLVNPAWADEKYLLQERFAVGDQCRVEMQMKLTGNLMVKNGEKIVTLKLAATAGHRFPERILAVDGTGMPTKTARYYEEAQVKINVHNNAMERTLRPERRFQVAQRHLGETVTYAPNGPITRDELELTGEHLDVLMIHGVLPTQPVGIGESWKVPIAVAQALGALDGLISHELQGKLASVRDGQAQITIAGPIVGIEAGAEVKINITGKLVFDITNKRLVSLEWKQADQREQGPVRPASKTETTTTMKRSFGVPSEHLLDGIVATAPPEPGPAHLLLLHRDIKGRWEFLHDRNWHVGADTEQYTVLRLLERGELLGQLNVTTWTKANPGQHLDPKELRKTLDESDNFKIDQVLQEGVVPDDEGRWIYRLSVIGKASELQMMQNYYAVAGTKGDQVILTFTTEVPQAGKLADRDLAIVGTVRFAGSDTKQAKN